ncbi:MAG: DinB family protein, partial [Bryobacteraceae bacterium]
MSDLAELLERFRRGPELIAVVLTGVGPEEADFVPAPGKWSLRQITAHLADAELVGAHRFRSVIAEDSPALTAYDQAAWAARLDYSRRKPAQSLDSFRRLRTENHDLLKALPESEFERAGRHSENGPMTLRQMVEVHAAHAESHARQIQAIRDEYRKR